MRETVHAHLTSTNVHVHTYMYMYMYIQCTCTLHKEHTGLFTLTFLSGRAISFHSPFAMSFSVIPNTMPLPVYSNCSQTDSVHTHHVQYMELHVYSTRGTCTCIICRCVEWYPSYPDNPVTYMYNNKITKTNPPPPPPPPKHDKSTYMYIHEYPMNVHRFEDNLSTGSLYNC